MKLLSLTFCALAYALSAPAQDSTFDPLGENLNLPKQIRVMVEFIELPLPELTKLLAEPRTSANDGDLRKAVATLIESGTAKHAETQFVIARSGETATAESISEYIYPSEYEPSTFYTVEAPEVDPADQVPNPSVPTSFETRNVGSILEIQPTIGSNNRIIDLRFAPEIVQHMRNLVWAQWKSEHGDTQVQNPLFTSSRINTGLSLITGQYCLAGTNSGYDAQGMPDHQKKLLLFVRADILTIGR